jgi:hypothetical protein
MRSLTVGGFVFEIVRPRRVSDKTVLSVPHFESIDHATVPTMLCSANTLFKMAAPLLSMGSIEGCLEMLTERPSADVGLEYLLPTLGVVLTPHVHGLPTCQRHRQFGRVSGGSRPIV